MKRTYLCNRIYVFRCKKGSKPVSVKQYNYERVFSMKPHARGSFPKKISDGITHSTLLKQYYSKKSA
jgi:hypothetical protein